MTEDVAATVFMALQLGHARRDPRRRRREAPRPLHERLRPALTRRPPPRETLRARTLRRPRSGSSPAASTSTVPRRWRTVAEHSAPIAAALDDAPAIPVRVVVKPVLTGSDGIRRLVARGQRGPGLRRPDHVDAHVQPGQDVDRRPRAAREAVPAPPHAVQPRDPLGRHRHGLHEPEPGRPRRPRVRVHRRPPAPRAQGGRRPLGRRVGPGADRDLDARRVRQGRLAGRAGSPASATTCARSPSPRATRSRPSAASASPSTPGASATSSTVVDEATDAEVDALIARYLDEYDVAAGAAAGRRPRREPARRRPHRARPAPVPRRRRLHRLHRHVRGPPRPQAAPRASPSSA